MKKLMSLAVAAAFSVSAAAWACDGMKNAKAEKEKAAKVATDKAKPEKKSDKKS
jgi:hypothetical protein